MEKTFTSNFHLRANLILKEQACVNTGDVVFASFARGCFVGGVQVVGMAGVCDCARGVSWAEGCGGRGGGCVEDTGHADGRAEFLDCENKERCGSDHGLQYM
jgi:hypothetical protein